MTKESITVRIDPSLRSRIDEAFGKLPYKPTLTAIIDRGISLAIKEAEALLHAANEQPETHGSSPCIGPREGRRPATYGQLVTAGETASHSKTVTSREATPAVEMETAKRGAGALVPVCPALIDDVGGQ